MHRLGLASLVVCAWTAVAYAQDDPIRLDTGITGTYVGASGRGGFGAVFEPKLLVHDQIAIGARLEAAVMFGGSIGEAGDTKMDLGAAAAVLAKGEYYATTGSVRPFVGFGLGMYDLASQSISTGPMTASVDQKAGRYFGVAPEVGIDLGRLRLAATYNMILGADIEVHQMIGNAMQTASYSQSYFTFELGFSFGARRKSAAL